MKIYPLTDDWSNAEFIKTMDAIINNGHSIAKTLSEADIILVGPDLASKQFEFVKGKQDPQIVEYSSYNNWLARHFEEY